MSSSRRKKSSRKKTAPKKAGKKPAANRAPSKKPAADKTAKAKKAALKKPGLSQPAPKQSSAKQKAPGAKAAPAKSAPEKTTPEKTTPGKKGAAKITKKQIAEEQARAGIQALIARLNAIADAPENQNCVWLIELVIPPGSFIARRVEEPVDRAELEKEVAASTAVLQRGGDRNRHRFLITYTGTGGLARQWAKAMCEEIPNPTVPMSDWDLFTIDAVLHAQFLGDEEY